MRAALLGVVIFLLAFARSMADGIGVTDESWFLQVVARIQSGEVLYRDVFLGTTPLSAYVTTGLTALIGVEIVAVKVVTNACFAATAVLAGRLAKDAGLSTGGAAVVMAATFIWARPYNNPPYTPMAVMFLLAAMVMSLSAHGRRANGLRGWFWAGALAGLSFASKQNVGLLALGSAGLALGLRGEQPFGPSAARLLAGFSAAIVMVFLPVAISGGLPGLWDFGFVGKGSYLDIGAVSYFGSLQAAFGGLVAGMSADGLSTAVRGLVLIAPVSVAVAALAAARRLDRLDWTMVAFALAAALVAFPRWDRFHMAYAVPVHLVALGRLLPRLSAGREMAAARRAGAWAVVALAVAVALEPAITLARGGRTTVGMAHFRGPLMPDAVAAELRSKAALLTQSAAGQPVFIMRSDAGFWYLASGVRNPTPFDVPARTATGRAGIDGLLDRLTAGDIEKVCLDEAPPNAQSLVEVETFVRAYYERGADVGPCTMYSRPSPGTAKQRS